MRDAAISFPMFGDLSIDPPYCFTIGKFCIYFYGVIIALGFILGALYCAKRAPEFGYTADDLYELLIWLIPICILGARIYFVLFKLDYYVAHPNEIFAIRDGGLAIYGGIIVGIITAVIWCRAKKKSFLAAADLTCFGLFIGQAVGRWGNFINREAFGGITDVFCRMGLTTPGGMTYYVHPTFLYESLWNFIGLIALHIFSKKKPRKYDGQYFLLYVLWYGLGRAWVEGLRTDSLYIGSSSIRVSQLLALISAVAALVILLANFKWKSRPLFVDSLKGEAPVEEAPEEMTEKADETAEAPVEDSPAEEEKGDG